MLIVDEGEGENLKKPREAKLMREGREWTGQCSAKIHVCGCTGGLKKKKVKYLSYCLERTIAPGLGVPHHCVRHPSPSLRHPSPLHNSSTSTSEVSESCSSTMTRGLSESQNFCLK